MRSKKSRRSAKGGPPSSQVDAKTVAIARIHGEIDRIKLELAKLRSQRNSFSPISRLSTGTLEIIFTYCARASHGEQRRVPTWVSVSYVCSRWRNIALGCLPLWTYLSPPMSTGWIEESMARSENELLKLRVYLNDEDKTLAPRVLLFMELMESHVERVEELVLDLPAEHLDNILPKFASHAPHLRNLKISVDNPRSTWEPPLSLERRSYEDTPALRALELTGCPVPWDSFKLSGLTTLCLHKMPERLEQSTFLAALRHMQDLTFLYLRDALDSATDFLSSAEFDGFQKIDLPRLSRLLIVAPLSAVVASLSCINAPLRTQVRLGISRETNFSDEYYTPLSSLVAQRFSTPKDKASSIPTIRSLIIESSKWDQAKLTFSTAERDCAASRPEWDPGVPLHVDILFNVWIKKQDQDRIVGDICCAVPLTHVRSVHMHCPPKSLTLWTPALRRLENVRYLLLSGPDDMPDLASSLSVPRDDGGPDGVFLPALEELELHDMDVREGPHADGGKSTTTCGLPGELGSLCQALSSRKESRGRLTVTGCRVVDAQTYKRTGLEMVGGWEGGHFHVDKRE